MFAVVSVATAATGLVVGLGEVTGLGIAGVVLVVVAVVSVSTGRSTLRCSRVLGTERTFADTTVTVQIAATHTGAGRSRPVRLVDPIHYPDGHTTTARRTIRSLAAGETERATYGLRVNRRGTCTLGSMRIEMTDPFGLARRVLPGPERVRLTVLPRIEAIAPSTFQIESELDSVASPASAQGSEFASLREYTRGDDLRKVHWRTSARRDELVVRRDAEPVRVGCSVLLDVRESSHDAATFEAAVSAAASILVASGRIGQPTRLGTTSGFDSTRDSGSRHLEFVLGLLAVVEPSDEPFDVPAPGADPRIVLTTPIGAASLGAMFQGTSPGTTVLFAPSGTAAAPMAHVPSGTLLVGADEEFSEVWARRQTPQVPGSRVGDL